MSSSTASPIPRSLVLAGAATVLVLAGAGLLWARFGTVVFLETIRTGFAACFG